MKSSKNTINTKKVPVECYSRIVGYFRPINQWNKGKKQEWTERHQYNPDEMHVAVEKKDKALLEARHDIAC